jgi:hypothetical protein
LASSLGSVTLRFRLFFRAEGEIESRAFVDISLCPHSASMFLSDALHRCQSYTRACEILLAMQPLENSK